MSNNNLSKIEHLYIHIPFCKSKCPYCDFFSVPSAPEDIKNLYTNSLINEFDCISKMINHKLKSLYFGGGSPLVLGIQNLSRIVKSVENRLHDATEVSIEINPEHLQSDTNSARIISNIKEIGITRVSIGVQTTKPQILKEIKRDYILKDLLDNIAKLKEKSISISLDFMFALPNQSTKDLVDDLNFVKKIVPDHVSFYLFTPPVDYISLCPDEKTVEEMFNIIHELLYDFGYNHYEISNYAKLENNALCIHNMCYWERDSYIGIGAGAHSFISEKNKRLWNSKDITGYIQSPESYSGEETISPQMAEAEEIMLGLRLLNKGIPLRLITNKNYEKLIENNLVKLEGDRLLLTTSGTPLLDFIVQELVP